MASREELGEDVGEVVILVATDKAILCRFDSGDREWVPRSQLNGDCDLEEAGDVGVLIVSCWFARKKGWGRYRDLG